MKTFDYDIVKNPEVFRQNRLCAHSDHRYYKKVQGDCMFSLNGEWLFSYAPTIDQAVRDFEKPEFDCRSWDLIPVPAHIQMHGYDIPAYVNVQYPWDGHEKIKPGQIPELYNPTASYVKYFTVPANMKGERLYISFQGVESAFALWLNGEYVGYSEDSFTPSEFELTDYIREGENKLAVRVFKWSSGSWCEDQDFFVFSGIFRDVYLFTEPSVHIRDMKIGTVLSDDFTEGLLELDICSGADGKIKAQLFDETDTCKAEECLELKGDGVCGGQRSEITSYERGNHLCLKVSPVRLWSAEHPDLYRLQLTVMDREGNVTETVCEQVGFRRIEIKDSIIRINGKRLLIRGTNRHEFCSSSGRVIGEKEIRKDLITMKRHNINAIRTSHYPNRSEFYRLADEYGFYVIDETNLETHGTWEPVAAGREDISYAVPGDRPEFREMVFDRARSMYERDKNHACIFMWSCGNESFGGSILYEMSELFRSLDPGRPVHYEGIYNDRRYPGTSDVASSMYLTAHEVEEYLKTHRDKPYISCEYAHSMGNSFGAVDKYIRLSRKEPLYQGGFIWDYIDQSLTMTDRYGQEFEAYGGDHGERPTDYNFSGNGIVYGRDRDPSPKMQEVKALYQGFTFEFKQDDHKVTAVVSNKCLFTDLSEYECVLITAREGEVIEEKSQRCSLAPGETAEAGSVMLPEEDGEYTVTFSVRLDRDMLWADKGFETAWGQTVLRCRDGRVFPEIMVRELNDDDSGLSLDERMWTFGGKNTCCGVEGKDRKETCGAENGQERPRNFTVTHGYSNIGVRGDHFEVLFSTLFGGMISYRWKGKELLADTVRPNFWRAMTDNDIANLQPLRSSFFKTAGMYATPKYEHGRKITPCEIEEGEDWLKITYTYHLPVTSHRKDCRMTYTVFADGEVEAVLRLGRCDDLGELPEISVMLTMDADYDRVTWYGLGPEETYADRAHAKLGVYENKAIDNLAKYLVPQECGNKMGVRWAKVTDKDGMGLRLLAGGLSLSVLPWSPQELDNARHATELPRPHYTFIRVGMQMGIGGDDTWGALVHPEYHLDNSRERVITFRFKGMD